MVNFLDVREETEGVFLTGHFFSRFHALRHPNFRPRNCQCFQKELDSPLSIYKLAKTLEMKNTVCMRPPGRV